MPAKIIPIPLSKQSALRLLRKTAHDASRVSILAALHEGPWRKAIDYRQIHLCPKEGSLMQEPKVDEHGNTVFVLERYSAGEKP